MLTEAQHAIRSTGVGASETAAALGLSPYCTPLELFERKRGRALPVTETLAMRFGNAAEAFILAEFQREHPEHQLVIAPDTMRRGHMLAHLDAWVPGRLNIQAKTARSRKDWGKSGSSDVPQHYLVQVQAEMLLASVKVSFIPVLFGGSEYDEFVVEADIELQDMIEAGVTDFWARVERDDPPEPVSYDDMLARYGRASRTDIVLADDTALAAIANLHELKVQREHLELAEEANKAAVMKALGECDTLVDATGRPLVTWRAQAGAKRFDATAFKAAHPDMHALFLRAGEPSRRFLLKP